MAVWYENQLVETLNLLEKSFTINSKSVLFASQSYSVLDDSPYEGFFFFLRTRTLHPQAKSASTQTSPARQLNW